MHYPTVWGETEDFFIAGNFTQLSDKDKALLSYLYPKPYGGVIKMTGDGHQEFLAVRKSVPRVVVGLTSLKWHPTSFTSFFWSEVKNVDETGFDYTFLTEYGTTLSFLAVDPHIKDIYMGGRICGTGHRRLTAHPPAFKGFMDLQWRKGLTLIHWTKRIKFNTKPTWGWSYVCHHPPTSPTIELGGGIDYVEYDWFAFSPNAINIYGGEIRVNTRIEDPKELRIIAVPKSVFRERPEIMVGISGFRYDGESPRCDKFAKDPLPITCDVSVMPSDEENDEAWIFDQRLDVCHAHCFIWITTSWVAVSKGNGPLIRPIDEASMAALSVKIEKKYENDKEQLERVKNMTAQEVRNHWNVVCSRSEEGDSGNW